MQEFLSKFTAVASEPAKTLIEWKESTGKKVVGCTPMHIPEEIIHSAGMLPVTLWGNSEPISLAHAHIQPNVCGFCTSILDAGLKGQLDFLDGWVFLDCCMSPRGLAFFVERYMNPHYLRTVYLPILLEERQSRDFLVAELERFKASLEEFSGQQITKESLQKSILVYNRNRTLLRKVYEIRRNKPGVLGANEVLAIVISSMVMPKDIHNELLEDFLTELEDQKPDGDRNNVHLVLSGSFCQAPRADILDMIEGAGAVVIDDDLYVGSRYMITDAQLDEDPIVSLADRYLGMRRRCPTKSAIESDWGAQLVELVNRSGAQGVISLLVKYCEPHYFYNPDLTRVLTEAGIPELRLEMEHEATGAGLAQIKTRVEAFIESISDGDK